MGRRPPPLRLHPGAAQTMERHREPPPTLHGPQDHRADRGARLTGSNVLFRLDKTSSVGAVNKGASPNPDSLVLLMWLLDLQERFDIQLIACHIPGRDYTLANCLFRLRGAIDD
eukprot:jgi/Tetstr1/423877/TSEL_014500.t1